MPTTILRIALVVLLLLPSAAALAAPPAASSSSPTVLVHKTPTCGCCGRWVERLQRDGFTVIVQDSDDLSPIKRRLAIPPGMASCHTAEVAGYFIEGHVPVSDIRRLLRERPALKGLLLPGMPAGSPGMEMPDGRVDTYTVQAMGEDGTITEFSTHAP
ncbi:MAG: DUF411 domain-containing protein [Rhodanobacteraceae bacterium]|nr:DUF411 domain-containing protein [Rhodanobacteraceae bacterium]